MSKETVVTVIGNVVNPPERKRTASGPVTNFRVASTAQRFSPETQAWVDKKTLYLDVECWNELSGNVSHSISKGDPVIVVGEMFTDEWETDQGRRSKVKLRAATVGPDLTRGISDFRRTSRTTSETVPAPEEPAGAGGEESLASGDYTDGSAPLYEVDSDDRVPEPALH